MARTSDRRQRELSRQKAQAATAARLQKSRRRKQFAAGAVAVVVVLSTFGAFIGSTRSNSKASTTTTAVPSSTTLPVSGITPPAVAPGATFDGATTCPPESGSAQRTTSFTTAPPTCIDANYFYTATITTTKGPLTIQLNPKVSPQTVNTFVVLARYGYYNDQPVTNIRTRASFTVGMEFSGGSAQPGFTIPGEIPPAGTIFTPGFLSMTKASASGGIGGQLVFATFDQAPDNDQQVTPLGVMLSGDATLSAINSLATQSGKPAALVTIQSISVVRSGAIPN